jgi:DNA segregation ATPase FtsK/SpoIIIE, S-DNA-T family
MAAKRTTPPRTKSKPSASQSGPGKAKPARLRRVCYWLLRFTRPRSGRDLLTLVLAFLGIGTAASLAVASIIHGQASSLGAVWSGLLIFAAFASRLAPWWLAELNAMTASRARGFIASLLLLFAALSLSTHVLLSTLGQGEAYVLLGPFSDAPWAYTVLGIIVLLAVTMLVNAPLLRWATSASTSVGEAVTTVRDRKVLAATEVDALPVFPPDDDEEPRPIFGEPLHQTSRQAADALADPGFEERLPVQNGPALPSIDIFIPAPKGQVAPPDLEYKSQRIQETLASFNVGARVVGYHSGPVVTQFDVQPDRGVKVKSIVALQNDLALALAAPTIRIQAPVPGKPVVGIEIPNTSATMVTLRDLLEHDAYRAMKSPLKVVLGKDVTGNPGIIDLAKMPHLLIAGATGSGKSVCVNAIISCLLYNNTPEDVRLMMVDPKMVELTVYNGVPHLLSPVVTHMDKVVGVLQWALREMERRYQLFASTTVRNISRYNEKMEANGLKKLPYIVFIIDELADLMMVAPEDVEDAICRLAQLARAAGIHLVIATQRPSVDVVTGLIKANFPARIAFMMTSQVDSRTILDRAGAEKLLGRGDMLYMPPDGPSTLRLQGANVTDQELERLVEFWQRSPLQAAVDRIAVEEFEAAQKEAADTHDELFDEATRVVREHQHASVSLLQRRLKVGYSRAARLMDQLEASGIVGAADGSKQRPVLAEDTSVA